MGPPDVLQPIRHERSATEPDGHAAKRIRLDVVSHNMSAVAPAPNAELESLKGAGL